MVVYACFSTVRPHRLCSLTDSCPRCRSLTHPDLHRDNNNDGWGAILTFGVDWRGFEQGYVTFALELPCPGWSLILGDYRNLLHYVRSGSGFRMSVVIANHKSVTRGEDECGREVWAPVS